MVRHANAPGVVKVRLSGEQADLAQVRITSATGADVEVIEASGPYPNRNSTGVRMYVTLRLISGTTTTDSPRHIIGTALDPNA